MAEINTVYFLHFDKRPVLISYMRVLMSLLLLNGRSHWIWGSIQKFPDWTPGERTANGTALCSCIAILWISLVTLPP